MGLPRFIDRRDCLGRAEPTRLNPPLCGGCCGRGRGRVAPLQLDGRAQLAQVCRLIVQLGQVDPIGVASLPDPDANRDAQENAR